VHELFGALMAPSTIIVAWGNDKAAYTEGYWRGARLLVEHVAEHARDQDFLVYPVIFLYRHHIELALKNLIMQAPYLIERELKLKTLSDAAALSQDIKEAASLLLLDPPAGGAAGGFGGGRRGPLGGLQPFAGSRGFAPAVLLQLN